MIIEKSNLQSRMLHPAVFFIIALIFALPLLLKWKYIGVGDWELFVTMADIPARTILHYGQFPFWNPYIGGGNILFAHPEVAVLSPFHILILIFGPIGGLKLQILICYWLGLYGTYLFSRQLGLSNLAGYLASLTLYGSSYFALHFAIGHIPFTHFCFLPWFLYFLLKSIKEWKYVFGSALAIALIILGNGAAVPFVYTAFFSGLFVVLYSIELKNIALIKRYIFVLVLGVLIASVKFIPMYMYLSQTPWEGMARDVTPVGLALNGLFSFNQEIFKSTGADQYWGWHEYGAYISPIVMVLVISGAVFCFKKSRIWIILGLFFFIFGLGYFSDISPWALFTKLPGFSSIRAPSRAFQFFLLSSGILAGFGLDYLIQKYKQSQPSISKLFAILIGLVFIGNFFINLPALRSINHKLPGEYKFSDEFKHVIGNKLDIYNIFQQNRGSLMAPWLSGYQASRGLVMSNNQVAMEYVLQGSMEVINREYTPNHVKYSFRSSRAGSIVFGIGYDPGWVASDGRSLYEYSSLVATDFGPSDSAISLYYVTPYFYTGLIISLIALGLALAILFSRKLGNRFETIFK